MDELQRALKKAFASEYSFALKAQNFHWNVEGPLFYQHHLLFETIYEEVYGVVDKFAEELRALQIYAPASYSKFSMLSQIQDENSVPEFQYSVSISCGKSRRFIQICK